MPTLEDARDLLPIGAAGLSAADLLFVYDESTSTPKTLSYAEFQESLNVPSHGRVITLLGDLRGAYQISPYVKLLDMSRTAAAFPHGITIQSWYVDCVNGVDPVTELTANLKYCTAPTNGQTFAAAAESVVSGAVVLVDVLTTTTGNASCVAMSGSDLGSGEIPAGKVLYLDMDADPSDISTTWSLIINFTANIA